MAETQSKRRLRQVAAELNVGTSTVTDFLTSKGIDIGTNPNAKVSDEAYELLVEKFQADKLDKLKAERQRQESLLHREERSAPSKAEAEPEAPAQATPAKEEAPVQKPAPEQPAPAKPVPANEPEEEEETIGIKVIGKIDLENLRSRPNKKKPQQQPQKPQPEAKQDKPAPASEQKAEKPAPAPEVENKQPEAKPQSRPEPEAAAPQLEPVAETPRQEPAPAAVPDTFAQADMGANEPEEDLSDRDTIDVDLGSISESIIELLEEKGEKTQPAARKDKTEAAPKAEEPIAEQQDKEQNEEGEEGAEDEKTARAQPRDSSPELKGLTVVGKIDLSKFQKPTKKVGSSKPEESAEAKPKRKKRKRKRISAVGSSSQPNAGQGQPPQQGQGQQRPQGDRPGQGGGNRPQQDNRPEKKPMDEKRIQEEIKKTLNRLNKKSAPAQQARDKVKRKKRDLRRDRREEAAMEQEETNVIQVTEFITANDLAKMMDVHVNEIIMACMSLGLMVSINQRLDAETISLVAEEFGYEVEFVEAKMDEPTLEQEDDPEAMVPRAPIVTIMGHVDHGKTSLLDYIRSANVVAGEAGGITQHIGAYEVTRPDGRQITFLDTPGHEAFTAMRARGAKVTDIAIIVIAADDSVMPQTREAISHAQAANVPIVFAFNKIDKDNANADRIREQLAEMNILVEEWGGKYQTQEVSAKKGLNVDVLLEKVLLEADVLELKADPTKRAVGTVIEASLDKGKGIVATVLVEKGTLNIGDPILAGSHFGRVKALFNERGQRVKKAGPATPVQVLGFDGAPTAGDRMYVTEDEATAKEVATKRQQLIREQGIRTRKHITLEEIGRRKAIGNFQELNLIIKGDVDGSVEALSDSLQKLSTEEVQVNVVHKGVGQISESDVLLATASDAIIIGFQVRPSIGARKLAENEQIDIRLYSIIYNAIEEVKSAMEGLLAPTVEEKITANVEIRETFRITKVGTVAGCYVLEGKINRNSKVRLIRDGVVIYTGYLGTLKRFKDDVREVAAGYECGLTIENYNDLKVGDHVEAFEEIEVARKL